MEWYGQERGLKYDSNREKISFLICQHNGLPRAMDEENHLEW